MTEYNESWQLIKDWSYADIEAINDTDEDYD